MTVCFEKMKSVINGDAIFLEPGEGIVITPDDHQADFEKYQNNYLMVSLTEKIIDSDGAYPIFGWKNQI